MSEPVGTVSGEEAWLTFHKSLNSAFSQGRRKTLKEHVGFSRSVNALIHDSQEFLVNQAPPDFMPSTWLFR